MKKSPLKLGLIAAALVCLPGTLFAQIQLSPVISTGLSSPVFVGHAGDGSNDSSSWNASESSACCSRARRNPRRFSILFEDQIWR